MAAAAQLACLLEASAPKPGNVSPGRHFHDTRYEDFLASACAVGPALGGAGARPLGETILAAVRATRQWTRSNTNLGIILLLAPLARAALADADAAGGPPHRDDGVPPHEPGTRSPLVGAHPRAPGAQRAAGGGATAAGAATAGGTPLLRARLARVLATTTVADAAALYEAIRLARPGGLGSAPAQDVRERPTVTLVEAMALAAGRDGVAREYATGFASTFEVGAPALARTRADGLAWDDAVVEAYLALLAAAPDTLLARKQGAAVATEVQRLAGEAVAAGGRLSAAGRRLVEALDGRLRDARNASNPGTTADLTASAIFVHLLDGGWPSPEDSSHEHADG